jgi:hypothetical protein
LKQTDFDGTTSLSDVVAVRMNKSAPLTVFPNPTQGDVIVSEMETSSGNASDQDLKFRIKNLMGKSVAVPCSHINGEIHLDLSTFAKGIYLLEIDQHGIISHHRIVLQN